MSDEREPADWDDWEEPLEAGRPGRLVPWALFLPALVALGCGFWIARSNSIPERAMLELEPVPTPNVRGFGGALEAPDGGVWRARLVPLHARAERQAFEAQAVARRLELQPGEPWRLELSWEAGAGAAEPMPVAEGLAVLGEEGVRLSPLARPSQTEGAPLDPLAVLFAPSESVLAPGESLQLLLWGSAPRERGRLRLAQQELLLEPVDFDAAGLPRAVARRGGLD